MITKHIFCSFSQVLDNLRFVPGDTLYICLRDYLDMTWDITSRVKREYPNIDIRCAIVVFETLEIGVFVVPGSLLLCCFFLFLFFLLNTSIT
jgi:hypothetical protein